MQPNKQTNKKILTYNLATVTLEQDFSTILSLSVLTAKMDIWKVYTFLILLEIKSDNAYNMPGIIK